MPSSVRVSPPTLGVEPDLLHPASLGTGTSTQMAEGQDADGVTEAASGYE